MTFLFPNDDALLFALTSGLVPPEISLQAVRTGHDSAGRRWIAPHRSEIGGLEKRLADIGVASIQVQPNSGHDIDHWLQAILLRRDPQRLKLTDQTPVLFEVSDLESLRRLSIEILRLGNDRQSLRIVEPKDGGPATYFLRVVGPPYYSLLQAIDPIAPSFPRAYLERAPGVWIECGWEHPLIQYLAPVQGYLMVLRSPDNWRSVANVAFRDIDDLIRVAAPDHVVRWDDAQTQEKIAVTLRLVPCQITEAPEFWVLSDNAIEQIDAFVRDTEPRKLQRLSFAVGQFDDKSVAVIRARPHRDGPPQAAFEAALAARSYLRLPHLYLPMDRRLAPPLRRDAVRQLLAPEPDRVVWLVPRENGAFVPQSLPESAFRPLAEWVEYIIEAEAKSLTAWMESAQCDFGAFVTSGNAEPAERTTPRRKSRAPSEVVVKPKPTPAVAKPTIPVPAMSALDELPPTQQSLTPSELQLQLRSAENRFLSIDGPLDDPRRQALWPELARLNGRLGHPNDATLCWSNAFWEVDQPPPAWGWAWANAEQALSQPELTATELDRWIGNPQPTSADLRQFAAALVWASRQKPIPLELRQRLSEVQRYLVSHDHLLPVRVVWLTWHRFIQQAGADVLALARARDRLLNRLLTVGLSAKRDLPGFLRYVGLAKGERVRTIVERMERLRRALLDWFAQPEVKKGELDQTPAYIDLVFAFGMARIGEGDECRNLAGMAALALDESGYEVHSFLLQAFQFRIDAALAGKPHAGPLPYEQLEYLQQLHQELEPLPNTDQRKFGPYAIERMRKELRILEPQDEFDPYRHTPKYKNDVFIAELMKLPDVLDRNELAHRIRKLLQQSSTGHRLFETRLRVLAGVLPLAARVGQTLAEDVLRQIAPALDAVPADEHGPMLMEQKALVLERGMLFAAHFDRPELVQTFLARLERMIRSDSTEGVLGAISSMIGQSLRSLRKLGLRDESERLLKCVTDAVLKGGGIEDARAREGRNWLNALRLLLNAASGWMYFEAHDRGQPILDAARQFLLREDKGRPADRPQADDYVAVVCAYIASLGQSSLEDAGEKMNELFASGQLDPIPNSYTTQIYYSRFHLNIAESLVLALANEDLELGPAARRWLDDDEYLIRRRIHRDMRAALAAAGM